MAPFQEGTSGNPAGRPLKGKKPRVVLTVTVAGTTKAWVQRTAQARRSSQGELIDELVNEKRATTK